VVNVCLPRSINYRLRHWIYDFGLVFLTLRRCVMKEFFDLAVAFVAKNWIFLALSFAWCTIFFKIVCRFWREVMTQSPVYKAMEYWLIDRWDADPLRIIGTVISFVWEIPAFLLLFPLGPILWIVLGVLDAKRCREEREIYRKIDEDRQARVKEILAENKIRWEKREKWLSENASSCTLFFKTMDGITAVLASGDYAEAKRVTERSRRDGFWESYSVLNLSPDTVVFLTKGALDRIRLDFQAPMLSSLDDLVAIGFKLEEAPDILVPMVNEALISFKGQLTTLNNHSMFSHKNLVEAFIPKELRPLPIY